MRFKETRLKGSYLVELDYHQDSRGAFARAFCAQEFKLLGLESNFVQSNLSTNKSAGTVRGLHHQNAPFSEVKLVRCIRGEIFDVIVDIRPSSETYLQYFSVILSESNSISIYVPRGFAHGYQALTDGATLHYMVSEPYSPTHESGLRYDDPTFRITWPVPVTCISDKDSSWPLVKR